MAARKGLPYLAILLVALAGCGKRANPLPPFSRVPHATADLKVTRRVDDVAIVFTAPWSNIDNSLGDLARVDVYAYTAEKPITDAEVMLRVARRVATVPLLPHPREAEPEEKQQPAAAAAAAIGAIPGGQVRVVEHLTPDAFTAVSLPVTRDDSPAMVPDEGPPLGAIPPDPSRPLNRYYAAITVARDGHRSEPSAAVPLPLVAFPPGPPRHVLAQYDQGGITLRWDSPAIGVRRPIQLPAVGPPPDPTVLPSITPEDVPTQAPAVTQPIAEISEDETSTAPSPGITAPGAVHTGAGPIAADAPPAAPVSLDVPHGVAPTAAAVQATAPPVAGAPPEGTSIAAVPPPVLAARPLGDLVDPFAAQWLPPKYNVYELPAEPATTPVPWEVPMPAPLNTEPIPDLRYLDARLEFGVKRCYEIRALNEYQRKAEKQSWEGAASAPVCVTPRDVFPPGAPTSVAAVATPGAVSLIWTANQELDLAGYIVLRGAPGSATLQRLTPAPVPEARYRDQAVTPGTRYVYVVIAIDTAGNESDASAPVEAVVPQ